MGTFLWCCIECGHLPLYHFNMAWLNIIQFIFFNGNRSPYIARHKLHSKWLPSKNLYDFHFSLMRNHIDDSKKITFFAVQLVKVEEDCCKTDIAIKSLWMAVATEKTIRFRIYLYSFKADKKKSPHKNIFRSFNDHPIGLYYVNDKYITSSQWDGKNPDNVSE